MRTTFLQILRPKLSAVEIEFLFVRCLFLLNNKQFYNSFLTLIDRRRFLVNLHFWFVCMNKLALCICANHTNAMHIFGFCLQVFCQAGPPKRVDCLAPMGNKRKVLFPRIQRRIVSSRIEPGVSDLSIINPTLYN